MADTYFDNREGREKSMPDCAKFGLTWNPSTQRCDRTGAWLPAQGREGAQGQESIMGPTLPGWLIAGALLLLVIYAKK